MGRKGKGGGYKFTVNDTSDAGEVSGSDNVELVVSDSDSDSSTGRTKKYVVAGYRDGKMSSIFACRKLTRNERLCLLFGGFALGVTLIIFVLIASIARGQPVTSPPGGGMMEQQPWMNVRLPQNILPEMYNITLHVDLETSSVTGEVNVVCNVTTPTQYVLIHAKDMDVGTAHVYQGGNNLDHEAPFLFDENDFYVIQLQKFLSTGDALIHLTFNYTLGKELAGFYRSSYTTLEGTKHYLATTQFEPTDARRAFPCFDEPSFKANFTISIKHNNYPQYWAASNMPVSSVVQNNDVSTTHFQTSVRMSTYLVAFVVSDFECVNSSILSTNGGKVKIRVCSNPTVASKTGYALEVAGDVLGFYEREFGVPYPLPKLDLFAIPDFSAGAMENWGLVTYRETALIYDSEADPETSKQRVAVVVAHELAHQWFGNLVTMAWWDGLWLNEGFASFMEYIGTDNAESEWNMLDQFVVDDLIGALAADSLNESHPILQEVSSPNEINSLFDSISYSKGGSVIRMLKAYLGQNNFKSGITWYLRAHNFGNADTAELWEALDQQGYTMYDQPLNSAETSSNTQYIVEVHPESPRLFFSEVGEGSGHEISALLFEAGDNVMVAQMMDRWTRQMGYPVLTVNQSTDTLSQTRFFAVAVEEESTLPPSPYNYTWYVPFNYITEDHVFSGEPQLIMESKERVSWPKNRGWIKVNVNQTGFYRVNYELANWWKLTEHLKQTPNSVVLTPADRAGLLDDVFALSSAGHLGVVTAFNFSSYLEGERHYLPWSAALYWMHTIGDRLSLTPLYGKYKQYLLSLLDAAVQELGFTSSSANESLSHLQILLRSSLLQTAWQLGHTDVIRDASDLFSKWKNNQPIDPNLKAMVYQVGVAYGSEADWEFMWQQYKSSTDPYEKRLFLRALAQSTEPWILSRYLNYSVTQLRTQDTLSVVAYVSRNVHGRYLAWNFVRNNWNYISETFGESSFFDRVIRYVTSAFSTELELCEVETFFKQHPNAGSGIRAYHQAIEVIRGNILWLEANLDILDSCLSNTAECFT